MNNYTDLYDLTSNIDTDLLTEALDNPQKKTKRSVRLVLTALAACLCIVIGIAVPAFRDGRTTDGNFFVVSACAKSENGLVQSALSENESTELSKIRTSMSDFDGFMFSVAAPEKDSPSEITYITYKTFAQKPESEIQSLMEEKGSRYFYFVPDPVYDKDGFIESVSLYYNEEDGSGVLYELLIKREKGIYSVSITDITDYPDGFSAG